MRTNYVLIDFENVQPKSLDQLAGDPFKIFVFVGAHQTKLPSKIKTSLKRLGDRAECIKISRKGRNALDFHIAYYIGQFAAADPSGHFHIISKDTGYDPLIDHLKTKKILARRVMPIREKRVPKVLTTKKLAEKIAVILARLRPLKEKKPVRVKTLASWISSLFLKQLSEKEVSELVQELVKRGYLTISNTKVTYALPGEA